MTEPSPLVIRRQEISLRPEPGALSVTESILVENPTSTCYVGRAPQEGWEPVTLRLAIPAGLRADYVSQGVLRAPLLDFQDGLVTGIAWPPGQRELNFTYVLPNKSKYYRWKRPSGLALLRASRAG